jgi:enoyl-CoA hydratase/carnithine racemase
MAVELSLEDLYARLSLAATAEPLSAASGMACIIVALDGATEGLVPSVTRRPECPVIGVGRETTAVPDVVDVVVEPGAELERIVAAVERHPLAAAVLARVLRHNATATMTDGLLMESLAYSALQHGAEFRAWLAGRTRRTRAPSEAKPPVMTSRADDTFTITLNRPERRNAYSAAMRDALCEALQVADADPSLARIVLRGAGPAFSAGGDLDEFGDADDAALAHVSRVTRSAAALLANLSARCTAELHGACIGAGIELPAYAAHIRARRDAFFQLPEHAMGLIPGAGGTVSITRRIGRHRTAYLALSNVRLDPETALAWGLIDELV